MEWPKPDILVSDNGTQFNSAVLTARLQKAGIEHRNAPVYAPHCNPVERTNRTIKTMISQYVEKDHRDWDENIPAIQFAYNTAFHDATGYTPAFLNFGGELAIPSLAPALVDDNDTPEELQKRLQEAFELVRINLARGFQRQERYYNLRRRNWRPQIGEQVWKKHRPLSNKAEAFNAKLAEKYIGPLEVRKIISPVIVDLKSPQGRWHRHVHVQDLKPSPANKHQHGEEKDTDTETEDENN